MAATYTVIVVPNWAIYALLATSVTSIVVNLRLIHWRKQLNATQKRANDLRDETIVMQRTNWEKLLDIIVGASFTKRGS